MILVLATTGGTAADTIVTASANLLPQLTIVAAAAITVGVGLLVFRRGMGVLKGLSK